MNRDLNRNVWGSLSLAALAINAALSVPAEAGLLTPNGNPTGANVANGDNGVTTLDPSPAEYMEQGECPWILPALAAQDFDAAHGWTINLAAAPLTGTLTLETYYAWADSHPNIPVPGMGEGMGVAAADHDDKGGVPIYLSYQRNAAEGSTDPNPATDELHWLQVISSNEALTDAQKAKSHDAGGGYYYFVDNEFTPANGPFYDDVFAGGETWFFDLAFGPLAPGYDTEFQAFLVKGNVAAKTMTIYDGVWWGYENTPEPATLSLLVLGGLIVVRRRRR